MSNIAWKEAAGDPAFPVLALELDAASPEDLLATVAEILVREGWVTTEFEQALKQREARFPTGLQLVVGALALPHTDARYCLRNGLVLARNRVPLTFRRMDDPDKSVFTRIVLTLVIARPDQQVTMLSRLSHVFTDPKFLAAMGDERSAGALARVVEERLLAEGREG
jgi:PTS system galactitol-specific IIA component